jgi:hypothetical protein
MRARFSKRCARKKTEKPNEAMGAIFHVNPGEKFPLSRGDDTRKSQMRGPFGEMGQCAALHVHKGVFAGGMHRLEDERARILRKEVKIVVILARERTR